MTAIQAFQIDDAEYHISELDPDSMKPLQELFEQCADYAMIVEGEPVSPTAAQEAFLSVPPGRSLSDKFLFGVVEENHDAYSFWQQVGFEFVRETDPRVFGKKTQRVYVMRRDMIQEKVKITKAD